MSIKPKRRHRVKVAQEQIHEEPVKQQNAHLESIVRQEVLNRMGTPPRLHSIRCHNVFENRWRVNVWVEYDGGLDMVFTSHKIAHSYFCIVSSDEEVACDPPIERLY